jgi:glycosyltransferase involved in cell wall biosynthesis
MSSTPPNFTGELLVTIAIPTFNRAARLKDCLTSALRQTYQNFEVVVSDNASTDETIDVLRSFSDPRVRVIRQKANIGLLPNWNACLAAAKGDYVLFVSDDDRIAPWMLERCTALINREPQIPVVIALCNFHSFGQTWPGPASPRLGTGIWNGSDILIEYLEDQIGVTMCSIVIKTAALRAGGGFRVNFPFAADVAAWAPLLLMGKAGLVNESCATYHIHSETQSSKLAAEELIWDGWKVADLISKCVDRSTVKLRERRRIKLQAKRCFARRAVLILYRYRRGGGKFAEVLSMTWRFRGNFSHIGITDILRLAWPIAIILFPGTLADWVRHLKRTWADHLRWVQSK